MASSEVEIVSSSPLGCVLSDHNGRKYRYWKKIDIDSHACVEQNVKDLVHSCFSASPENAADSIMSQSEGKKADSKGVSSLVKKWRVFEAAVSQNLYQNVNSSSSSSRSNSITTLTDNSHILDGQIRSSSVTDSVAEKSEAPSLTEESCLDSESDRTCPSSRDSTSTEKEKMRVADIIKKLKIEDNEQVITNVVLPKVRTSSDHLSPDIKGHGSFIASPRIRGRRLVFNDLIVQLERDRHHRHQEVQRLEERKAVTKFSHRGRLQAMLKVKMILHEKEVRDGAQINSLASGRKIKNSKEFSVMHLREKFNSGLEQNAVCSSPRREVINNIHHVDKLSSPTQLREAADHTPNLRKPSASGQLKEAAEYSPNMKKPAASNQLKVEVDHTPSADNPSAPDVDKPSSHVVDYPFTLNVKRPSAPSQPKEAADYTPNVKKPSASGQLKVVVDHIHTPSADNPSAPDMDKPSSDIVDYPFTPNVDNPSTSIQLKEVVYHSSAGNPTTSTQHIEEIHPPEVAHSKRPRKMVVNVKSNSTSTNEEDDVNRRVNVVCPTPRSLKDIIHSWERTHLRSFNKNEDVTNETLEVDAWSTSDRVKIDISRHDVINPQQNSLKLRNKEIRYKKVSPNLDVLWQDTAFDTRSYKSQKSDDSATSPGKWKDQNDAKEKVDDEQRDTAFDTRSFKSQKSDDSATSPGKWKDRNGAKEKVDDEQQDTAFDTKSYKSQKSDDNATSPGEWKDRNNAEEKVDNEQQDTAFDTKSYKSQKSDDNATSPDEWKDRNNAKEKVDTEQQDTAFDTKSYKSQKSDDNATSPDEWKDRNEAEEKVDNERSMVSLHELVEDNPLLRIDWEEQPDREKAVETFPDWTSNFSQSESEYEEDEAYENMEESNLDWVYDVCRPRSDWECLRQKRYQEMLDPFTSNGDIKRLLERKNVSSFLSSQLRNKIDELMISRTQGPPLITNNQAEKVKQEKVVKEEERYAHEEHEKERAVECYPEEEEDQNPEGTQNSEAGEFSYQTPSMTSASPDIFIPWSDNQEKNVNNDHVASSSLRRNSSFGSPTLENQHFSSLRNNHPSIEMELISDLRGHMEQLHMEIFDLRKSLHTCMDMQVKMQHFMMRQAESIKNHSNQNRGTGSIDKIPRNRICCLCFEEEVDSLLYRCGHMCTCYKCAHQMQRHSGICPICQAPILDIVRTYTN